MEKTKGFSMETLVSIALEGDGAEWYDTAGSEFELNRAEIM
jgi:hypothetical protein